jgi:hypothetical protein
MAAISSDADLRAHLRRELGLGNSSQVGDDDIDAEIQSAKDHLSTEIARKVESGESLDFYSNNLNECLQYFLSVRLAPLSNRGGQKQSRIPKDHPRSLSQIRRTDFENTEVNFWRDRMSRAFNRI